MSEDKDLQIERYIGDLMISEERKAFELELSRDSGLEKEVGLAMAVALFLKKSNQQKEYPFEFSDGTFAGDSLGEYDPIKSNIREVHRTYVQNFKKQKQRKRNALYTLTTVAASVLIIVGIYFFTSGDKGSDLYAIYYEKSDLPSFTVRSDTNNLISRAAEDYKVGNLNNALSKFETYLKSNKQADSLVFIYTAMIYAEKDQLASAIEQLELLENSNSLDAKRALWFKALVYLKFDEKEQARTVLEKIAQSSKTFKNLKAIELLEEL